MRLSHPILDEHYTEKCVDCGWVYADEQQETIEKGEGEKEEKGEGEQERDKEKEKKKKGKEKKEEEGGGGGGEGEGEGGDNKEEVREKKSRLTRARMHGLQNFF